MRKISDTTPHHHANENYPPFGTIHSPHMFQGNGGRDPHYIWTELLPLMSLEKLFSIEDSVPGQRFGSVSPASFGRWKNFQYHSKCGGIETSAQRVRLDFGKFLRVTTDACVEFREFNTGPERISFRFGTPCCAALRVEIVGTIYNTTLVGADVWQKGEIQRCSKR